MKYSIVSLLAISLLVVSCSTKEELSQEFTDVYQTKHFNLTIAPDLSNRVKKAKPVSDVEIINSIIEGIYPSYLTAGGRTQNQKDTYSLSFINKGLITNYGVNQELLNIDFSSFESQNDRIAFIKGREEYDGVGLKKSQAEFVNECHEIYTTAAAKSSGADIWTYFNQRIGTSQVKNAEELKPYGKIMVQNTFQNVLVLITDGYIESGIYKNASGNQSYDLSKNRIDRFRQAYLASGVDDMVLFFTKNGYGLVPANNPSLKNLEVIVLELDDRSLTSAGNATVHPTDAEIIDIFWTDWLTKSGVNRFELHQKFDDVKSANEVVSRFLL